MSIRFFFVFLIFSFSMIQCGDDKNQKKPTVQDPDNLQNKNQTTNNSENSKSNYFRVAELKKGKEIHQFSYMYPLKENELNYFNEYYKVLYDDKNRVIESEHYIDNSKKDGFKYYYDSDNKITKVEYYLKDDLLQSLEYKYNQDKESEMILYDKDKKILRKRVNTYKDSKLVSQATYKGNGKTLEIKYEYNKSDQLTEQSYYRLSKLFKTYHYDKGRIVKEDTFDKNEVPVEEINFTYNDKGQIIKENYSIEGKQFEVRYKYNDNGDRIQLDSYKFDKPHGRWITLNDKGNPEVVKIYTAGKLQSVKKLKYNERYQLTKEEDFKNNKLAGYYAYFYDNNGQRLKCEIYDENKKLKETEKYLYKDNKLVERELLLPDGKVKKMQKFLKGRWVSDEKLSNQRKKMDKKMGELEKQRKDFENLEPGERKLSKQEQKMRRFEENQAANSNDQAAYRKAMGEQSANQSGIEPKSGIGN